MWSRRWSGAGGQAEPRRGSSQAWFHSRVCTEPEVANNARQLLKASCGVLMMRGKTKGWSRTRRRGAENEQMPARWLAREGHSECQVCAIMSMSNDSFKVCFGEKGCPWRQEGTAKKVAAILGTPAPNKKAPAFRRTGASFHLRTSSGVWELDARRCRSLVQGTSSVADGKYRDTATIPSYACKLGSVGYRPHT